MDIHTWATYQTRVAGEDATVRVRDVDTDTYSIPMAICTVVGGRFDGETVAKTLGELRLSDESAAVLEAKP